ncbi:alkaline phosphatase family protein [Brevibacterium atlanticum]|uniref:hypothetical protein n=1 Tax=Brevibacterium atlanticum TaxID=2697563 RepID=UPI001D18B483|nr:hypothetical protein [Brevibacterium atlanticum]
MTTRVPTTAVRVLLGALAVVLVLLGLPQAATATQVHASDRSSSNGRAASVSAGSAADAQGGAADSGGAASAKENGAVSVSVSGFSFEDLDPRTTPHLWVMMKNAQIGTITPRSVRSTSCPVDGWLGLGSGRRAADEPRDQCREPAPPMDGWVADWDVYAQVARGDNYDAALGSLAEAVPDIRSFGNGAAIAAATPTGHVKNWSPVSSQLGSDVAKSAADGELTLVDLGNTAADGYSLKKLDAQVGDILEATGWMDADRPNRMGEGRTPIVFSSIADGAHKGSSMQATMMLRPGQSAGLLTSSSTRQPGLVQVPDLAPTLVQLSGAEEMDNAAGAPMTVGSEGTDWKVRYQAVLDRQVAVKTQNDLSTWFFPVVATLMLGLLALAWFLRKNHRELIHSAAYRLGVVFAAMPISTYLVNTVPWERATNPDIAMLGALVGWSLLLGVLALLGPWRRHKFGPVLFVSVITVCVLAYDVMTGSQLQMSTLLGEPLLIASRFYGIGNSALALYCCALLLAVAGFASLVTKPLHRVLIVTLPVLASCVILAAPGLGTKFGSVPTLIIGVAYLVLAAASIRFSIKRLGLTVGIAGFVMLAVLFLDWLRPADQRTHFGRFFDSIISGQALGVLARKIGMNIDILTQSWMTLVLPLFIIGVFWLALDPHRFGLRGIEDTYRRIPLLRAAVISLAILLGVGTVINDSGIVVPAVGVLFLVPILAHLETFRAGLPRVPEGVGVAASGDGAESGDAGVAAKSDTAESRDAADDESRS